MISHTTNKIACSCLTCRGTSSVRGVSYENQHAPRVQCTIVVNMYVSCEDTSPPRQYDVRHGQCIAGRIRRRNMRTAVLYWLMLVSERLYMKSIVNRNSWSGGAQPAQQSIVLLSRTEIDTSHHKTVRYFCERNKQAINQPLCFPRQCPAQPPSLYILLKACAALLDASGDLPTGELSYRWYVLNPTAGGLPTTYSIMDRGCQNRGENFHDNSTTSNHDVIFQHGRGSQHMSFAWCAIRSSTVVLMGSFAMNIEMQLLCARPTAMSYSCQLVDTA